MASTTYLQRTVSSTGNRKVATFSAWFKRGILGERWFLNAGGNYSTGYNTKMGFDAEDGIFIMNSSGSTTLRYQTTRKFRDVSAWYHIVVALDTTNSTSADRVKIYVNGTRETSFSTATVPSLNLDLEMNQSTSNKNLMAIGTRYNAGELFDGLMSHVHWCDGTALAPTVFGSTDSTTGEWKINTAPSFTPGTNGFTILRDGNTITDQSANSNNFSLGAGAITITKDCPDNNFATMNPLVYGGTSGQPVFSNGNTTVSATGSGGWHPSFGSIGVTSGKWYFETKVIGYNHFVVGIANESGTYSAVTSNFPPSQPYSYGIVCYDLGKKETNNSRTAYGASSNITNGQIIGTAFDLDNNKLYWSVNGTFKNSGNPASGSTGTGSAYNLQAGETYFPMLIGNIGGGSNPAGGNVNFGNGFFGTTAITTNSGNGYAGAEGKSKFNYAVPSGYSALSTKGLNQ